MDELEAFQLSLLFNKTLDKCINEIKTGNIDKFEEMSSWQNKLNDFPKSII